MSRAVRAAVETCVRWVEHDADVHAIADTLERLKEMHRHACGSRLLDINLTEFGDRIWTPSSVPDCPASAQNAGSPASSSKAGDRQQVFRFHAWRRSGHGWKGRLVLRKDELEVRIQGVARCDAVALIRCYVKAGILHAQRSEDAPFEQGISCSPEMRRRIALCTSC